MLGTSGTPATDGLDRRQFLGWTAKHGIGLALVGGALPALLAACGDDDDPVQVGGDGTTATSVEEADEQARAVVGDVIDFSLTPDGWAGAFGFVTMKLHRGSVDDKDVWFVRTDASDRAFATAEELVFVPKLAPLARGRLSGAVYCSTTAPRARRRCSPASPAATATRRPGRFTGLAGAENQGPWRRCGRSRTPSGPGPSPSRGPTSWSTTR